MTLVDEMMEPCVMLDRQTASNGMGGYTQTYTDGAMFEAAILKDSTTNARIAEKNGFTESYTVYVYKGSIALDFHDVFRRERDGLVFRVTGNANDSRPPASATDPMQLATVPAERWVLPQ